MGKELCNFLLTAILEQNKIRQKYPDKGSTDQTTDFKANLVLMTKLNETEIGRVKKKNEKGLTQKETLSG